MAHSPLYHIQQHRQLDTLRHSPFDSNLPVKPLPVADVTILPRPSSDEPHHTSIHASSLSHISSPTAIQSISESSTGSYSQPASPRSGSSQHFRLNGAKKAETEQKDPDHRHIRDAGYSGQTTRVQNQMLSNRSSHIQPTEHTAYTYTRDDSLDERVQRGNHALRILVSRSARYLVVREACVDVHEQIWLSCFCPVFSLIVCFYAIGALFIITILAPLHLCFNVRSYRQQIVRLLSPSLNTQISSIHSLEVIASYSAPMLVIVHLLSPFISVGVAVAAWVAASFWFYAAIIGDPDGTHGKDDGRAAVLGVQAWWERWLLRASRSIGEEWA